VNETLFQLINYRYNNELPTVFTSNADVEGVEDRIRSRMLDNSLTERWAVQAPDYRLTAHSPASNLLHSEGNAAPTAEAAAPTPRRTRRKR
jgi:DNA replication protein DnaC